MESFIGRLNDINSKISQEAMETYIKILPLTAKFIKTNHFLKYFENFVDIIRKRTTIPVATKSIIIRFEPLMGF